MPDWSKSMQQTFEYYEVDPATWRDKRQLSNIKACTITRDSASETLGSASIDLNNDLGECYIREYLVTIQNGIRERFPLGTHLVQTTQTQFDGKVGSISVDAYTPLLELKESQPPIGYYVGKNEKITTQSKKILRERMRAPVVGANDSKTLYSDFIANTNDTWLSFNSDLLANAKYQLGLDELGRVLFQPIQSFSSLQPVHTYDDSNSSILYPEITKKYDIYGIPNVVEVVYSQNSLYYYSRVVNDDQSSPISTISRGREIVSRVTNPEFSGLPSQKMVDEYAEQKLKESSTIQCTLSYTHGYCGTRLGDCVLLNYERAGIVDVKAKVTNQTIKCEPGCPVSETAVYTIKLWG